MAVGQGMADILADIQVLEAMTDILAGIKDSLQKKREYEYFKVIYYIIYEICIINLKIVK